jgi:mannose-1-phosphate guanylyltransferase
VRRSNWLRFAKTSCDTNYKAAEDLKLLGKSFGQAPAPSLDYAIMEKANTSSALRFLRFEATAGVVGVVEFP